MDEGIMLARLLLICCIFVSASSDHLIGGSIMVRPKADGAESEIEITAQFLVRRSRPEYTCNSSTIGQVNSDWEANLKCWYNCRDVIVVTFYCTEYSVEVDWSLVTVHKAHTFNTSTFNFSDTSTVSLGLEGCCWKAPYGQKRLNVSVTFSLVTRADTGKINSSPRIGSFPYLRLQEGQNHTIPLAVRDPDNDDIRCRWATGLECGAICDVFPGAVLNNSLCSISYYANSGTGSKAVAIMVEDFLPGSLVPLSSTPFQFYVTVVPVSRLCLLPPHIVVPARIKRDCTMISSGTLFTKQIIANSVCPNVTITSIQVFAPDGTSKGDVQHIEGTNNYYTNITWMPAANQHNIAHFLCFVAVNSEGLTSEQFCIKVVVGDLPVPLADSATPNNQLVDPFDLILNLMFDTIIQRPLVPAFIRFYTLGEEVYQVDTLSPEVTFNGSSLTIIPNHIFTKKSTYVIFDEGVVWSVNSIEGCHLVNEPIVSKTFWTFEVLSPNVAVLGNQAVGQPLILQCSVITKTDINSRVDFVWISNGIQVKSVGIVGESSANNSVVYRDYYIIRQLTTAHNNSVYTCEVIINEVQPLSATDVFTLHVFATGTEVMNNSCSSDDDDDNNVDDGTVDKDGGSGDDDNAIMLILFAVSAAFNLSLVAAVTLLICLLVREKKKKSAYVNYKITNRLFGAKLQEPVYDLPNMKSQEIKSVANSQYFIQDQKGGKSQKQHTKSDGSEIILERNPSYHIVGDNNL